MTDSVPSKNANPIEQLAQTLDAGNKQSVQRFFGEIEKWSALPDEKRKQNVALLTRELEQEGKLPQLIMTSGLGDSSSNIYNQFKEPTTGDINKDDLEVIAERHKKGSIQVDVEGQLLAMALLRNFGNSKGGISYEYSGHSLYIADGKIDYKQIGRWAGREDSEGKQRHALENALLQWNSLPGGNKLNKDDLMNTLRRDDDLKKMESSGVSFTPEQRKAAGALTVEQREALEWMRDNFNTIRSIDNSGTWHVVAGIGTIGHADSYDDFITKDKLEYYAKKFHTSSELAVKHNQEREQLKAEEASLVKDDRGAAEKADPSAKERTEQNDKEAKERADREAKERADKEAKERADKEAKERADKEAKERADKEAKERADKEAKERADKEAKERADKEAKERADKEAKERADKEAKEKSEREAKEKNELFANNDDSYRRIYERAKAENKSLVIVYQHGASPDIAQDTMKRAREHFRDQLVVYVPDDAQGVMAREVRKNNASHHNQGQPLFQVFTPDAATGKLLQNKQRENEWSEPRQQSQQYQPQVVYQPQPYTWVSQPLFRRRRFR